MGQNLINILEGDITQIPSDAIITDINSWGMWFGSVDGVIQKAAGNYYHAQAERSMPLKDLQVIIAKGGNYLHNGKFRDVVFVVDDLKSPLNKVISIALDSANHEGYKQISVPAIRMGSIESFMEKTKKEAVDKLYTGVQEFLNNYNKINLKEINFVIYNDPFTTNLFMEKFSI